MKRSIIATILIAAALLLSGGVSPAAESEHWNMREPKAIDKAIAPEKSAKAKAAAAARGKLVDINSAGKKELKTLPDIGDAEAVRIIAGRPYLTKADLVTRDIVSRELYEDLKTRVIAKQKLDARGKLMK